MNRKYFSARLLERLERIGPADADPLRVIIRFKDRDCCNDFARVASRPAGLLERYRLAVAEAVENSLVTVSEVQEKPKELKSINAVSTALPVGVLKALSDKAEEAGIKEGGIELDFQVTVALDRILESTGASTVQAGGLTGRGVVVAVVDTGIDRSHPDLSDRVLDSADFTGEGSGDRHGHGTHVAGIVAGAGNLLSGKYRGVAPGASLLEVKVLGRNGGGSASGVIQGIEWFVEKGVHVANLSIEGPPSDGTDPLSEAADWAAGQGVVVCAAAGNIVELIRDNDFRGVTTHTCILTVLNYLDAWWSQNRRAL